MNNNIFIILGNSNLFQYIKNELNIDSTFESLKKWLRVHNKKHLYVVHFSFSEENLQMYNNIKMDIMSADSKAVITSSQMMSEPEQDIGSYLFIHCIDNDCIDILQRLYDKICL